VRLDMEWKWIVDALAGMVSYWVTWGLSCWSEVSMELAGKRHTPLAIALNAGDCSGWLAHILHACGI